MPGTKLGTKFPGVKANSDGENAEYNMIIVCENTRSIFVGSAKTKASSEDVDELRRDVERFFRFCPQYKGYKVQGALAAMNFGEGVGAYALRQGFYVFRPSGELMKAEAPGKPFVLES